MKSMTSPIDPVMSCVRRDFDSSHPSFESLLLSTAGSIVLAMQSGEMQRDGPLQEEHRAAAMADGHFAEFLVQFNENHSREPVSLKEWPANTSKLPPERMESQNKTSSPSEPQATREKSK
jgi:hypothetical protein